MSFLKYPEYKDSGIEWLGEVPAHWDVKQLKYLVTCLDGQRIPLNGVERYSKQGSVPYWGANKIMDYVDEAIFDEELVLLGEDGAPFFDVGKPVAFHSSGPVWPNNHIHVLRPGDSAWVKSIVYGLNATNYIDFVEGSTRDKLTQSRMMSIPLAWPPHDERNHIDSFLDHETARIDALVEEQQRLIELLKEKRQAVISHAVTKGLDPDVPMKDSGVEWLGEVPAHWKIPKITQGFSRIGSGTTPPSNEKNWYEGGSIPWVTSSELRERIVSETKKSITQEALERFTSLQIHPPGSLAIAMYGATIGRLGILGVSATCNQACCMLSGSREIRTDFAFYWLFAFRDVIISLYATGGGQPNINQETIANLRLPVPSFEEQSAICSYLDAEVGDIEALLQECSAVIDLLQERRSALISAAVTGKIDVRGWKPPVGKPTTELAQGEMV